MKVSVIISICDNRKELFKRSLDTWTKQTEKNFELIIVDDADRTEIYELCKSYDLNFQYVNIDNSKCDVPITTFTPVLSNNIGFRVARGEVVCITGPETLQSEKNIEVAQTFSYRKQCGYGLVYKSNTNFVKHIDKNWPMKKFSDILKIQGAAANCLTRPPHPPAYYYFMAVSKMFVEKIGGLDERFGQGFCAEDDDFANRMKMIGVEPVFEHKILGIHQDHSQIDKYSKKHSKRKSTEGIKLRNINIKLMKENQLRQQYIANTKHIWGDLKVITNHEVF